MRDIIDKKEGRLTVLRIIGFVVLITGAIGMMASAFFNGDNIPNIVAMTFFLTMLGFSLAFPSLLEGSEGLSTMRIIVFMITNVICMLLLRIGWAPDVDSLAKIGLDEYWMGLIAFVFGAKATQSFFESKMAVPKQSERTAQGESFYTSAEIAKRAATQNEDGLKARYPNIMIVSDAAKNRAGKQEHVVALYLKDKNDQGIPPELEANMADGTIRTIATEIIKGAGAAKIQYSQLGSEVNNDNGITYPGSLCCGVRSTTDKNFQGFVTSAHIQTNGKYTFYDGELNPGQQTNVLLNGKVSGKWFYHALTSKQDLAVVKLDESQQPTGLKKFNNSFYEVTDNDVEPETPNITMLSKNNKITTGYIIDHNIGLDVNYDKPVYKKNVILVSANKDRTDPQPISEGGDSGSCIYHTETGKLIGILLGSAEKFSLVLPIEYTLKSYNLTTV